MKENISLVHQILCTLLVLNKEHPIFTFKSMMMANIDSYIGHHFFIKLSNKKIERVNLS